MHMYNKLTYYTSLNGCYCRVYRELTVIYFISLRSKNIYSLPSKYALTIFSAIGPAIADPSPAVSTRTVTTISGS